MNPPEKLLSLLSKKKLIISTAESCTGGLIGAAITAVPGASEFFMGGCIAYDNRIKEKLLGVPPDMIEKYGAVSSQTVEAMAVGAARLFETDCAVSVSGIAGPGGGTPQKPVGLVYIGIFIKDRTHSFEHRFTGDRECIRKLTTDAALDHLCRILETF
jgi:PncC family amidohydrolase